jgi:hypothetical protein
MTRFDSIHTQQASSSPPPQTAGPSIDQNEHVGIITNSSSSTTTTTAAAAPAATAAMAPTAGTSIAVLFRDGFGTHPPDCWIKEPAVQWTRQNPQEEEGPAGVVWELDMDVL